MQPMGERGAMKKIAIFIDGTWNRPDAEHPTNVLRLSRTVAHMDRHGTPRVDGLLDA